MQSQGPDCSNSFLVMMIAAICTDSSFFIPYSIYCCVGIHLREPISVWVRWNLERYRFLQYLSWSPIANSIGNGIPIHKCKDRLGHIIKAQEAGNCGGQPWRCNSTNAR